MEKNKLIIGIIIALILIVGGVAAFYLMQPKEPTIEEANVILDESIKKTYALTSFTAEGSGGFQVKSGEIVITEVVMRDMQFSATDVWSFANQDSRMIITYDVMINLTAIADFIEARIPSERLKPDIDADMPGIFMGIDPIAILRTIGKANITVSIETKSIDNDSYMKVIEVIGLRETITSAAGAFVAEMVMSEIKPKIGIWIKTPAPPEAIKGTGRMAEKIDPLVDVVMKALPDILFVKKVLPNTRVNDVAVYNFADSIDLNKTRDLIISLIPLVDETMKEIDEMVEEIMIGEIVEKDEMAVAEIQQNIKENWPKIATLIEAMEIDSRTYICQKTRFVIKDAGTVNVNLYRIMTALEPMIIEDIITPEELAEFNEFKERLRDISFTMTGSFVYSNHNAVPTITPPAEYQFSEGIFPF